MNIDINDIETGDYEVGDKVVPERLKEGDVVFLSKGSYVDKYLFVFLGATDNTPLKSMTKEKALFPDFDKAYKHFKGDSEKIGLLFETPESEKQSKLVYSKTTFRWGINVKEPTMVQRAELTEQGKMKITKKINKGKLGKFKDFLEL